MEATTRMGFFSPRRFGHLLLREMATGYRSLLIAMAAIGAAILVISLLFGLGATMSGRTGSGYSLLGFYQNLLLVGGLVVTSLAFREIRQNGGGIFYLTIPGSIFEKFTTKLLMTSVGYALGSAIFFTAATAISQGITLLIFGTGPGVFNPLSVGVLRMMLIYIAVQSVVLLGSVWFRRIALVKTALAATIFVLGAAVLVAVVARIVLAGHFAWHGAANASFRGGWNLDLNNGQLQTIFAPGTTAYAGLMVFRTLGKVLLWLAAPVAWLAGYFRLREVEV
jgi:hypothetical protein